MSFASNVKKELTEIEVHPKHARAELAALVRMNGTVSLGNRQFILNVQTENAATARRIYNLIKNNYEIDSELIVRKKMKLKKNHQYIVLISDNVKVLLEDLHVFDFKDMALIEDVTPDFAGDDQLARSYLRGAFLSSGSVNDPKTSAYHLEIYSQYREHNESLAKMMEQYGIKAKITRRRSGFITYIKEAEKIADFLRVIGATNAMLSFEDVRILRDMRNSVNRLVNCDTANIKKTINAANNQVNEINKIDQNIGLQKLPFKLRQIAELRIAYPEMSLQELSKVVPGGISKSGINHRLKKISEIAAKI